MKGACDDVYSILKSLYSIGVTRDRIFVHLDTAFNGGFWHLDKQNPNYQIGEDFYSITICGNKWHGADVCGIFAMYQDKGSIQNPEDNIDYLKVQDIGITSCRNGFNAISWMVRYLKWLVCIDLWKKYNLVYKTADKSEISGSLCLFVYMCTLP